MKVDNLILVYALLFGLLCISLIAKSDVPKDPFLGIPPQDLNYFKISSDTIKCKDGSKKFTKAQLNDDFCDCPDGTDEPGTSACPGGKFYCRNAGHIPLLIFSSRVNDGICDCCDGSDEYDGKVKCQNTCWEAGKVARDRLRKKISTYKEGVAMRNREILHAKLAIAKDEAELAKLKNEENILKGLVQQLKDRKEQIEKAEERERLQKEKEEKEKKEAEEKANGEKSGVEEEGQQEKGPASEKHDVEGKPAESFDSDKIGVLDDAPLDQEEAGILADHVTDAEIGDTSKVEGSPPDEMNQQAEEETKEKMKESISQESKGDSVVVSETGHDAGNEESHDQEAKTDNEVPENTEGLSKEELGKLVASRWTGSSEKKIEESNVVKDDHEDHEDIAPDAHDETYDGYSSETDDDTGKYDDDVDGGKYDDPENDVDETYEGDSHDDPDFSYKSDPEDEMDFSDTTSPSKPTWLEKIQQTVRNILQAVSFFQTPVDKSEAARVRKEYEESNSKLSKLQSRISSLTQKLRHDFGTEKEFYSFYNHCFESKQNKYTYKVCPFKHASQEEGHSTTRLGSWDKFENSYREMVFSNGDRCWNGPDRSLRVRLRCGLKNEVTDVDEPSRCEYVAFLSTPALCLEEKLQELEDKLELMNEEQPQGHDEL